MAIGAYEVVEESGNQLFGKTLVSGPRDERVVALTYRRRAEPAVHRSRSSTVLRARARARDVLRRRPRGRGLPAVVRREVSGRRDRQSHLESRPPGPRTTADGLRVTLERTDDAIFAAAGVHTRIMRPPYGARDWLVLDEVRNLGYTPVMWSVPLANDWEYPPAPTHC